MELREYMSIRRAYNLIRQATPSEGRLTFEEFAILAHLQESGDHLKTSAIADYQDVLRPTMTHRTNHLAQLGFISRHEGEKDRRNVYCTISDKGVQELKRLSQGVVDNIPKGQPLSHINAGRVLKYVDAMGAHFCTAGDLALLGLEILGGETKTVTTLVKTLGLLQPTVSMSISSASKSGYVTRKRNVETTARTVSIVLTEEGKERAKELTEIIQGIVVHSTPHVAKTNE